jgi:hypothetical protein
MLLSSALLLLYVAAMLVDRLENALDDVVGKTNGKCLMVEQVVITLKLYSVKLLTVVMQLVYQETTKSPALL